MGFVKDALQKSVSFITQEVMPIRHELVKAGLLAPREPRGYEPKANLSDPYSFNMMNYGYKERFSMLDYYKLRQISYADPIVAAIIQTRTNQVASFAVPQVNKYKVGFKISLRDKKQHASKGSDKHAHETQRFIMNCGFPESFADADRRKRDSFEQFLRKITRDSLTFDQLNFEVIPRRNGMPAEFLAVDAGTMRLLADAKDMQDINFQQGQIKVDYTDVMAQQPVKTDFPSKKPLLCQVMRGTILHTFDEWEMAFGVRNPRTDILANGYGFSEIEMLIATVAAHMNAETYNRKFFSQGSAIKGVLTFEGSVPPDQLEAFRRQWHQQVSGVNNAWKTPILSLGKDGKLNWQSLHSNNREMEWGKYMEYLIKSICGVFQIDPIEIGFDISKNPSGASSGLTNGGGFAWDRLQYSMDKGLGPLLRFIQHLINEYLVWRIDPDFEFEFVGLESRDEKDDTAIEVQQVKAFKTVNELRAEHDLDKLPEADQIKSVGDIILDPTFLQAVTALNPQTQAMAMAGAGGGGGGPPGAAGGKSGAGAGKPGAGGDQPPEPDYESMSSDDLHKELAKLTGGGAEPAPKAGGVKPGKSAEQSRSAPVKKSLELLL